MPPLPEDQSYSLDDTVAPPFFLFDNGPSVSLPVEDDEMEKHMSGPHECSQSEVTFLGVEEHLFCHSNSLMPVQKEATSSSNQTVDCDSKLDLYGSWPVECSCAAGAEGQGCEDCWANGYSNNPSFKTPGRQLC